MLWIVFRFQCIPCRLRLLCLSPLSIIIGVKRVSFCCTVYWSNGHRAFIKLLLFNLYTAHITYLIASKNKSRIVSVSSCQHWTTNWKLTWMLGLLKTTIDGWEKHSLLNNWVIKQQLQLLHLQSSGLTLFSFMLLSSPLRFPWFMFSLLHSAFPMLFTLWCCLILSFSRSTRPRYEARNTLVNDLFVLAIVSWFFATILLIFSSRDINILRLCVCACVQLEPISFLELLFDSLCDLGCQPFLLLILLLAIRLLIYINQLTITKTANSKKEQTI